MDGGLHGLWVQQKWSVAVNRGRLDCSVGQFRCFCDYSTFSSSLDSSSLLNCDSLVKTSEE